MNELNSLFQTQNTNFKINCFVSTVQPEHVTITSNHIFDSQKEKVDWKKEQEAKDTTQPIFRVFIGLKGAK